MRSETRRWPSASTGNSPQNRSEALSTSPVEDGAVPRLPCDHRWEDELRLGREGGDGLDDGRPEFLGRSGRLAGGTHFARTAVGPDLTLAPPCRTPVTGRGSPPGVTRDVLAGERTCATLPGGA
jgi:hypothetical protein